MPLPPADQVRVHVLDLTRAPAGDLLPSSDLRRAEQQGARWANARAGLREIADKLERLVADDLWPLPKYSEVLFIK